MPCPRLCVVLTVALIWFPSRAAGQSPGIPSGAPLREGFGLGVVLSPALEGGGPWLMTGLRISTPLGSRAGLDVESGAIFGGKTVFSSITSFNALQLRLMRTRRADDGTARAWLVGLFHVPVHPSRSAARRRDEVMLTIGRAWDQVYRNGARLSGEVGFRGGVGYMVYATVSVQAGTRR